MKSCSLMRYELKYQIPFEMIDEMINYISVYCKLDKHSKKSKNLFYCINSLYFDSPNFIFLKNRLTEEPNRFNMRIRSYGQDPHYPYFLEIKQRKIDVIRKYRSVVHNDQWIKMIENGDSESDFLNEQSENGDNLKLFYRLALTYRAAPKILIQYRRLAYESMVDNYTRITFDTDLCYQDQQKFSLIPDEESLVHFDNETIFNPGCNVILEIKCYTDQIPIWIIDFIRIFNLTRNNFSKYCNGITEVLKLHPFHF